MLTISPVSSATVMNSAAGIMPRVGCSQRTRASSASKPARAQVDLGLEVQAQAALVNGVAQTEFELAALVRDGAQLRVEDHGLVAATALGAVERDVGPAEHLDRVGLLVGRETRYRCWRCD